MTQFAGTPTIFDLNPFESSDTQQHDLGALGVTKDGRRFRYAKAGGTALVAGHILQAPAIVANHQNIAVEAAVAAGATSMTATLGATAATADQYAGGYVVVNDVNGEGHTYEVKGHASAASSGVITLKLKDKVKVALTTSSEVCLIANPYNGVIDYPTTATGTAVGVAPFAVAASKYCWIQSGGVASVLADGAIAVMSGIAVPATVAGSVKIMAATLAQVGYALQAGVDTEYRAVYLTID